MAIPDRFTYILQDIKKFTQMRPYCVGTLDEIAQMTEEAACD
jgi:hypothetical protein